MVLNAEQKNKFDVAVVGASVVGLTTALGLSSLGYRVALLGSLAALFSADSEQPFDSRVFALNHSSQRLLERLNLWAHLNHQRIQPVAFMQIWGDQPTVCQGELQFGANDSGVSQLNWIVEQQTLLEVLSTAVQYQSGITWLRQPVQSMKFTPQGWFLTTSGATLHAQLVVAADGAQSFTRQQAGLDFEVHSFGAKAVVATWNVQHSHRATARQWFNGQNILAMLPLPGSYVSMVWSMPTHQANTFCDAGLSQQVQMLQQVSCSALAHHYGKLHLCGKILSYPLSHGVAPIWYENQVALIGDAAHVVHPLAGLGLNLGFEDVSELIQQIEAACAYGQQKQDILINLMFWKNWQRKRKAACASINWLTQGLHYVFRVNALGVPFIRNAGMRVVNAMPSFKRWLCSQAMR